MTRWTPHFAGLSPLDDDNTAYCLALVRRKWFSWHITRLYCGPLGEQSAHCLHTPIAIAVLDSHVIHWVEEFPLHLSRQAIHAYLKHAKPELFANPANTLSLEKLPATSPHSSLFRCWLLTETICQELCQPWQQQGFTIGALEPLSYLDARCGEPYRDDQQLFATIKPCHRNAARLALKLACRDNWAVG